MSMVWCLIVLTFISQMISDVVIFLCGWLLVISIFGEMSVHAHFTIGVFFVA